MRYKKIVLENKNGHIVCDWVKEGEQEKYAKNLEAKGYKIIYIERGE